MTLHDALGLVPYTTSLAAVVSVALVTAKAWRHPGFAHVALVVGLAGCGVLAALVLHWRIRSGPVQWPPRLDQRGATSWVLALQLGVLLLTLPVLALVKNVEADALIWTWPYLNKRWLVALYLLAIGTFVLFPVAIDWVRSTDGDAAAPPAGAVLSEHPPARTWPAARTGRTGPARNRLVGGLVIVLALAGYFAGPPWHLDRHHRDVESHEQAHLGPLQAISKGYVPYVGPASTQYGPGSQMVQYHLMRLSGHFDIVSFRATWATFNFIAWLAVAVAAYWWLGLGSAIAVMLVAIMYSPLASYGTAPDGTLSGFYGWASALRYIAPVLIVPTLVRAAAVDAGQAPLRSRWVGLLGVLWGAASWISQENLSSTAMAAGLLLALLGFTRTIPFARAVRIARDLLLGFALAALPICAYYALHGTLGQFFANYVMVPRAVAAGYSNTWWPRGDSGARLFYTAPVLLLALAIATLWRVPSLELVSPLDRPRARFLAFLSVQLVCYQVALLRSDAAHLQNTMLALPFVVVAGARDLPRWLATATIGPGVIRVAFVIVALVILPAGKLLMWRQILVTPYTRFATPGASPPPADRPMPIAYQRATRLLIDEPHAAAHTPMSMRTFLDFANDVHAIVGDRKTYVAEIGEMWSGPLYFFADLTPAPYPFDRETMTINAPMRAALAEHIRTHPREYESLIGTSLEAPEAKAFLDAHPGASRLVRHIGPTQVYILLSR